MCPMPGCEAAANRHDGCGRQHGARGRIIDARIGLAADEEGGRVIEAPATPATAPPSARATFAWVLAQAVRDPFVTLIQIYVFAPYYVTRVIGDPVAGQTLIASANKWGGWVVMLTAPLLGAVVDRVGPRKPGLALVVAAMVLSIGALWFTPPGGAAGITPNTALFLFMGLSMLMAYHELFHNALLLPAAGMRGAGRASGFALAGGNALAVLSLIGVLWAFALPGKVHWGFVPAQPLLGLDAARGEPERIVTLLVAGMLALGSLPLFLRVPDLARSALSIPQAIRAGARDLVQLFVEARGHRDVLTFLAARMIYTDALTAILIFGGLFAAGTMHWAGFEMLGYGIILSVAAVVGGFMAGWLDTTIGPKLAVKLELVLLIAAETAIIGVAPDRILFRPYAGPPLWHGPMFTRLPEIVFLGIGCLIAVAVSAAYASSRTLLTRVAPPGKTGVFFGLYVLSGTATMWLGPLLVEIATKRGGSQAAGFIPVVGMLIVGLVILMFVRGGGRAVEQ